jgi:hypothetical protein
MTGTFDLQHLLLMGVDAKSFGAPGTKEIPAAKRIAAQIIESFWSDGWS